MNESEWATFYRLLSKITDGDGTWKEKKAAILLEAEKNDADTQLEEFVNWFHGSTDVTA